MEKAVAGSPFVFFDEKKGIILPQPTRFWIVDRELKKAVSRLEEKGWIKRLEEEFTGKKEVFDLLVELHEKEISLRRSFLERAKLPPYAEKKLLQTGIGGIGDYKTPPLKIKCLHLWTAYHLGDERFKNPIGSFVLEKLRTDGL
ncbi:MAG: DUF501 domain-containing protein [Aquificae bacterium]|nr:DUF501 domain-containing protein [Aquificota bacterium]